MDDSANMREDWNARARENAYYYVALGPRYLTLDEFLSTATEVVLDLESELARLGPGDKRNRRALEIGCGPGRLLIPMSWNFGEVHGVDVSDEMIRRALRNVRAIPNAFPRPTAGIDLADFPDDWFDFVYSHAVFQRIPSREVVFNYLAESRRVLKSGGILRCQLNGLPATDHKYTTWDGVRIAASDVAEFAALHDMQLLAIEGFDTQDMWTTMRKQPAGWFRSLSRRDDAATRMQSAVSALTGAAAVPAEGRYASFSLSVENVPPDCDLNSISIAVDGIEAAPLSIGHPGSSGVSEIRALLPKGVRTGLVPVEILWLGEPLGYEEDTRAWMRVIPAPARIPRVTSIGDGVNAHAAGRIESRMVKICIEEVASIDGFTARLDGAGLESVDTFCTDPLHERYEISITLPPSTQPGPHRLDFRIGSREFPATGIEIAG